MEGLPLLGSSYGEGVLGVTMKRFKKEGIQLQLQLRELNRENVEKEHIVHIVAANFCVAAKISDPRAVEGDVSITVNERQQSVIFVQKQNIRSPREITDYDAVFVVASKAVMVGQEHFVDYSNRFSFEE